MGRIVFLHFLQKKGWLNGNLEFLRDQFFFSPNQDDFLEQVLEPLFFGIFNTEVDNRERVFRKNGWNMDLLHQWNGESTDALTHSHINALPYLNGGLFERDAVDELNIKLPASLFEDLFRFLASYNFTVDENDPDDAEVGVDPEMLGKIFDSLLEDNKAKGAFYTPKEIVHYMCKESLIAYLSSKLPVNHTEGGKGLQDSQDFASEASRSIRRFVETHEMQPVLEPYRDILDQALRNVKICDPAIGSGAFPMGLLNELWRCREALYSPSPAGRNPVNLVDSAAAPNCERSNANNNLQDSQDFVSETIRRTDFGKCSLNNNPANGGNNLQDSQDFVSETIRRTDPGKCSQNNNPANGGNNLQDLQDFVSEASRRNEYSRSQLKKEVIENNIYGVDIERGAIDIARLRFWLSIVVDAEEPEPLPNFDYKFMQGNSLIESFDGFDLSRIAGRPVGRPSTSAQLTLGLDSHTNQRNLHRLIKDYFRVTDHQEKAHLRRQINDEVKLLIINSLGTDSRTQALLDKLDISANQDFFLWHTWFKDIFDSGGFDIVIGNPPYGAKYSEECKKYYKRQYITAKTITGKQKASLDTFTLFIEQGYNILKKDGNLAYIVPIALTSSDSLSGVHRILLDKCDNIHISSYADRPKPVFERAVVNTSILLFTKTESKCKHLFSTKMHRRNEDMFNLQYLVDHLQFADVKDYLLYGRIPKIGTEIEKTILEKIQKHKKIYTFYNNNGSPIYYRTTGGRYFKVVTNYPTGSTKEKPLMFETKYTDSIGCVLSSSLSFWFYQIYSNNLDWKSYEIENFTLPQLNDENIDTIEELYSNYLNDIEINANIRTSTGESKYLVDTFKEYKIVRSKSIIDEIDDYIGPLYGLTPEEIDFIKNYELEFRMAGE